MSAPIKKLKATNEKGVSLAPGGLTGRRRAQSSCTICVQVGCSIGLVVGSLWAEGKMGMCQLPIKILKATNEKGVFLAPGGLTGRRRARSAGTIRI